MLACEFCAKIFKTKKTLNVHLKYKHDVEQSKRKNKCAYPNCDEPFITYDSLLRHLYYSHDLNIQKSEIVFANTNDFDAWKQKIEVETNASFVLNRGSKKLPDGTIKSFFHCHRSFCPRVKEEKIRQTKTSSKIGRVCPAHILKTEKVNKSIYVEFFKDHVGHENEAARLRLNKDSRQEIAEKLKEGIVFDDILNSIRQNGNDRMAHITKRTLRNIRIQNNISPVPQPRPKRTKKQKPSEKPNKKYKQEIIPTTPENQNYSETLLENDPIQTSEDKYILSVELISSWERIANKIGESYLSNNCQEKILKFLYQIENTILEDTPLNQDYTEIKFEIKRRHSFDEQ